MCEELVKRLRELHPEEFGDAWDFAFACQQAMCEAADAIEELSMKLHGDEAAIVGMQREIERMVVADKLRWIPVAEALPENDTAVLAHVYWPEYGDTMICYGHWHKGWFHLFHHVEGELISGYVVTHWMLLPEPPKEG